MNTTEKLAEAARGLADYLHASDYGDMPRAAELVDAAREALAQFDAERAGLADGEQVLPPLPMSEDHKRALVAGWFAEDWAIEKAFGLLGDYEHLQARAAQSSQPLPVRDEREAFIEKFGRLPESAPMIYVGWQARAVLTQPAPEALQDADGGYCPGCTPANCGRGLCGRAQAAEPAPAGEAVAVVESVNNGGKDPVRLLWYVDLPNIATKVKPGDKLYTTPPPAAEAREPMSDERKPEGAADVEPSPALFEVIDAREHKTLKAGDLVRMVEDPTCKNLLLRDDWTLHLLTDEQDQYVILRRALIEANK